jgi:hypothetical protein
MTALAWKSPASLRDEALTTIEIGDLVRTGENLHPHYVVVALTKDRAWIRDTQHGTDHVVALDRCLRI